MAKIYVVTRGCYSEYGIERVFLDPDEAEKYCATHNDQCDDPMIEIYDTDDNEKIECGKVYKAFKFEVSRNGNIGVDDTNIMYSLNPIKKEIYKSTSWYSEYNGQIPYEGEFEAEKFKKIAYDEIAKFKAQEAGL